MSSAPVEVALDAVIVKHPRDRRLGLAFGEHELGVLELDDLLAEGLALLDVVDGERERPLDHGLGMDDDDEPLARQIVHELREALALLRSEQVLRRQPHVLEEQLGGVGGIHAELLELAAAAEAGRVVGFHHHQRDALGARARIGLGDHDDQVGVLAVGDEGLRAIEHVAVAGLFRRRAHALQVGAGAGLAHGDGADELAGHELGQPAPLLLFGAVMQNVGRNDAGMQRRAEGVEAGEAQLPIDHRLVREGPADTAVFFGDRGAQQARRAGLGPDLALVLALLAPAVELGRKFGRDEAPRLLLEQHDIFGHPAGTRKIEDIHDKSL